ncbi:UNKNOWN [Stylonychia lemnae]|uniref:C2 domain-containing protein n=1 Tax=Stylonychia lemnae TaxID=5949 RepID=A0A078A7Y8_STYLE|nr:UNKNOWN [Stylonychia lemnae]|eukprot:CDW78369.1 UNKNOWN [Stylonychia lemnae]
MGNTCTQCCHARDRNDKTLGIETRNHKFFFYNYPLLIKDIEKRLNESKEHIANGNKDGRGPYPTSLEINHFKWVLSQLQVEIEQNFANLEAERMHRHKRRLAIEICDADGFLKIPIAPASPFSQNKCLIRVQFNGIQKKTKKNINCINPKFFEIFRYSLPAPGQDSQVLIQVIFVEQKDDWKVVAQTFMGLKDFEDQLVHPVSVNMNVLREPVRVISDTFKHRGELSEFSFSMDGAESWKQSEYDVNQSFNSRRDSLNKYTNIQVSQTPRGRLSDNGRFNNFLSPNNVSIDQQPWSATKSRNDNSKMNEHSALYENSALLRSSGDMSELYSGEKIRLNLKVQMITDGESYIQRYLDLYDIKLQEVQMFIDQYGSYSQSPKRTNKSMNFQE